MLGMIKIASESPATKTLDPATEILLTGKGCLVMMAFVLTRVLTISEFSQMQLVVEL